MMPYNPGNGNIARNRGDIGENYVKYRLSQKGIDSIIIDRVYDLFLWQRDYKIEVKTSRLYYPNKSDGTYRFKFSESQCVKDAFDYAVCCCLDDENNINDYYIIPQGYIRHMMGKNKWKKDEGSLFIKDFKSRHQSFYLEGNSYDLFEPCHNLDFDLFLQDNKSAFTRKKNALIKKLIDYPKKHKVDVLEAVKDAFNNETVDLPIKYLTEKFKCSYGTLLKMRELLKIPKSRQGYSWRDARHRVKDDELKKQIPKLWRKGHTRQEMCALLDCGVHRIHRLCKELTLPKVNPYRTRAWGCDSRKYTKEDREEAYSLFAKGLTSYSIAKKMRKQRRYKNLAKSTINVWIKEENWIDRRAKEEK